MDSVIARWVEILLICSSPDSLEESSLVVRHADRIEPFNLRLCQVGSFLNDLGAYHKEEGFNIATNSLLIVIVQLTPF